MHFLFGTPIDESTILKLLSTLFESAILLEAQCRSDSTQLMHASES